MLSTMGAKKSLRVELAAAWLLRTGFATASCSNSRSSSKQCLHSTLQFACRQVVVSPTSLFTKSWAHALMWRLSPPPGTLVIHQPGCPLTPPPLGWELPEGREGWMPQCTFLAQLQIGPGWVLGLCLRAELAQGAHLLTTCSSWLLQMGGGARQAHEPSDHGRHAAGGKSPQTSRPGEACQRAMWPRGTVFMRQSQGILAQPLLCYLLLPQSLLYGATRSLPLPLLGSWEWTGTVLHKSSDAGVEKPGSGSQGASHSCCKSWDQRPFSPVTVSPPEAWTRWSVSPQARRVPPVGAEGLGEGRWARHRWAPSLSRLSVVGIWKHSPYCSSWNLCILGSATPPPVV